MDREQLHTRPNFNTFGFIFHPAYIPKELRISMPSHLCQKQKWPFNHMIPENEPSWVKIKWSNHSFLICGFTFCSVSYPQTENIKCKTSEINNEKNHDEILTHPALSHLGQNHSLFRASTLYKLPACYSHSTCLHYQTVGISQCLCSGNPYFT